MNSTLTFSISDLRKQAAKAIDHVIRTKQPAIILQRSQPKVALVDLAYFEALEDAVMDAADTKEARRAKKEPRDRFDSYMKKRWGSTRV